MAKLKHQTSHQDTTLEEAKRSSRFRDIISFAKRDRPSNRRNKLLSMTLAAPAMAALLTFSHSTVNEHQQKIELTGTVCYPNGTPMYVVGSSTPTCDQILPNTPNPTPNFNYAPVTAPNAQPPDPVGMDVKGWVKEDLPWAVAIVGGVIVLAVGAFFVIDNMPLKGQQMKPMTEYESQEIAKRVARQAEEKRFIESLRTQERASKPPRAGI